MTPMPRLQIVEQGSLLDDEWEQRTTIREIFVEARILTMSPCSDGRVIVQEACDHYYGVAMTPDDLRQWAEELRQLADVCERSPGEAR